MGLILLEVARVTYRLSWSRWWNRIGRRRASTALCSHLRCRPILSSSSTRWGVSQSSLGGPWRWLSIPPGRGRRCREWSATNHPSLAPVRLPSPVWPSSRVRPRGLRTWTLPWCNSQPQGTRDRCERRGKWRYYASNKGTCSSSLVRLPASHHPLPLTMPFRSRLFRLFFPSRFSLVSRLATSAETNKNKPRRHLRVRWCWTEINPFKYSPTVAVADSPTHTTRSLRYVRLDCASFFFLQNYSNNNKKLVAKVRKQENKQTSNKQFPYLFMCFF